MLRIIRSGQQQVLPRSALLAAMALILTLGTYVAYLNILRPPASPTIPPNGGNGGPIGGIEEPPPYEPPPLDLEVVRPNELGLIPILMYHEIGREERDWTRTADNFRSDLQRLYDLGYRTVALGDVLDNNISVPAGCSPVVLTFDDGTAGQFRYLEQPDGTVTVDPDCAVGILLEFASRYPDFGSHATFYLYYPLPFRQSRHVEAKLNQLVEMGMELGNHTHRHADLSTLSADRIQEELGLMARRTAELVPGYAVRSLALPYGKRPPAELYGLLREGAHDGFRYRNDAVLLVGANPSHPPNHRNYDPGRLPRIRASEPYLDQWLSYLEGNPERRYISDGDPAIITFPASASGDLNEASVGDKVIRTY